MAVWKIIGGGGSPLSPMGRTPMAAIMSGNLPENFPSASHEKLAGGGRLTFLSRHQFGISYKG